MHYYLTLTGNLTEREKLRKFINILRFFRLHADNMVFLLIEFPNKRYYNDNAVFSIISIN